MAVRLQVPKRAFFTKVLLSKPGKVFLALLTILLIFVIGASTFLWVKYSRIVDAKLSTGPFANTAMLFAAPETLSVGDPLTAEELVQSLKRRGYSTVAANRAGWYNVRSDGVEIFPGVDSYFDREPAVIFLRNGAVARIISNRDNTERPQYFLEPELITNLFDRKRQKRRVVSYDDIPKVLVNALISAEDKRFFQHAGFDPLRIIRTAYVDLSQNRRYGASTITMQLARGFWLDQEKTWKRKAEEAIITLQLERKLTKERILEYYCNSVDLGRRRSFEVHGFGEASQVYFGKDIRELTLPEAALLAGLIQRPNYLNPYRWPDRAKARRDIVLGLMHENGYVTDASYEEAVRAPVRMVEGGMETTDAPYFVDMVYDDLQDQFQDQDFQNNAHRIYTTLDLRLQREAVYAVQAGMNEVDALLAKLKKAYPEPQVAMVVLDPATAEVKAMVGGRSYGTSQLNRALSRRQPGSAFKPFVYAAALNSALDGAEHVITPVSTVVDERTTFLFDGKTYEPGNYHGGFSGTVNLRTALAKSLNVPTVKFAEIAGYDNVADLARNAGMNRDVKGTPAVALGAYEVTPVEIAGAYTVFSNQGVYLKPNWIRQIRGQDGGLIYESKAVKRTVLDPRVSYMVVNLMEEVLRSGTGAGARSRGFALPAAGKTGTSHDAWFAGFTSKLLCVVWVGFDDNQELPLEGAKAALPIWVEFMKRAHQFRDYRGVRPFQAPDGIVTVDIDPLSGQLARASCPKQHPEVFIAGTEPVLVCSLHGGGAGSSTQIADFVLGGSETPTATAAPRTGPGKRAPVTIAVSPEPERPSSPAKPAKERKGIWGRIRDIFK